jgi:hypothetical protein
VSDPLRPRLAELRRQAREVAGCMPSLASFPPLTDVLLEINLVRVLMEWPVRVANRGSTEPWRRH